MPSPVYLECSLGIKGGKVNLHNECRHYLFARSFESGKREQVAPFGPGEYQRALTEYASLREKHTAHRAHVKRNDKVVGCGYCYPEARYMQSESGELQVKLLDFIPQKSKESEIFNIVKESHWNAKKTKLVPPLTPRAQRGIKDALGQLLREMGNIAMPPTDDYLLEFVNKLQGKISPRTGSAISAVSINSWLRCINSILGIAATNKVDGKDIFPPNTKLPRRLQLPEPETDNRIFTKEEFKRIQAKAKEKGIKYELAVELMGTRGLREAEITQYRKGDSRGIRYNDIELNGSWDNSNISIIGKTNKGGKNRLKMTPSIYNILKRWPHPLTGNEPIIEDISDTLGKRINQIIRLAGVKGNAYSLRKTAIDRVYEIDEMAAQEGVGRHRDRKTTDDHYRGKLKDARLIQAFKKLYEADENDDETALKTILDLLGKYPALWTKLMEIKNAKIDN